MQVYFMIMKLHIVIKWLRASLLEVSLEFLGLNNSMRAGLLGPPLCSKAYTAGAGGGPGPQSVMHWQEHCCTIRHEEVRFHSSPAELLL